MSAPNDETKAFGMSDEEVEESLGRIRQFGGAWEPERHDLASVDTSIASTRAGRLLPSQRAALMAGGTLMVARDIYDSAGDHVGHYVPVRDDQGVSVAAGIALKRDYAGTLASTPKAAEADAQRALLRATAAATLISMTRSLAYVLADSLRAARRLLRAERAARAKDRGRARDALLAALPACGSADCARKATHQLRGLVDDRWETLGSPTGYCEPCARAARERLPMTKDEDHRYAVAERREVAEAMRLLAEWK